MKSQDSFDHFFKSSLQNHKAPVPKGLWEKIEAEKETNKPIGLWYKDHLFRMVLFSAFLLSATFFFSERKQPAILAEAPNTHLINTSSLTNNYNNRSKQSVDAASIVNAADLVTLPTNKNGITENFSASVISPAVKFLGISEKINAEDATNPTATRENNIMDNSTRQPVNEKTAQLADIYKDENEALAQYRLSPQEIIPVISPLLSYKDFTALKIGKKNPIFGLECPNGIPYNWFVEAYGSADINTKSIYGNDIPNSDYINRIDSTTSMRGGFTFGVRLTRNITDHILFKTGIQYTQINERFKSKTDSIITITTVFTSKVIVRGNGLPDTTIRDTSTLSQIGYRVNTIRNKYKSIEIPLIASYERGNDKWRYAINAGAIVNLTSWYSGETFDTAYKVVPLSDKQANGFYKSNINLSLYAGVSVYRKILPGLEAFAEPYIRYNLSNAATSGSGYAQRFNSAGLSIGIRYKLNRKSSSTED